MSVCDPFPATIDLDVCDRFFYCARSLDRLAARNQRRWNKEHFTTNNRTRFADVDIHIYFALKSQPLDRLLGARAQFVVARSLIYDRGVAVGDVRNVGRLIDDRDIALARDHAALDPLAAEFFRGDETILVRANIIITVGPIMNAAATIEARFRR